MDSSDFSKTLKRVYFLELLPAIVLIGIVYLLKNYTKLLTAIPVAGNFVSALVLILSIVVGIAFPVFYRSYFVYKIRDQKRITTETFINFEKVLIFAALTTPYFLFISLLINMKQTANLFITMLLIYAVYYYFPSEKKMRFEMKIFRIKPLKNEEAWYVRIFWNGFLKHFNGVGIPTQKWAGSLPSKRWNMS